MIEILALLVSFWLNPQVEIVKFWEPNPIVTYAYEESWYDLDFVLTLERESGFNPKAVWDNWTSFGLCQFHNRPDIVNDERFSDPYWQVDKCLYSYTVWKEKGILHKRLFWYNARAEVANRFTINIILNP